MVKEHSVGSGVKILFTVVYNQKKNRKACTQKPAFCAVYAHVEVHKLQRLHCYMGNRKCCGGMWCQFQQGGLCSCHMLMHNLQLSLFETSVTLHIYLEETTGLNWGNVSWHQSVLQPTWAASSSRTKTKTLAQDWESNPQYFLLNHNLARV